MPLQPAQRDMIVAVLGVRPRPKGVAHHGEDTSSAGPNGADGDTQNWFTDKVGKLVEKVVEKVTGSGADAKEKKAALLARLQALSDPPGASADQIRTFGAQRKVVQDALAAAEPVASELATAGKELDKLSDLIDSCRRGRGMGVFQRIGVADLKKVNPEAAKKADKAFKQFAAVLGATPATPEALKKASDDKAVQQRLMDEAAERFKTAGAMPAGKPKDAALQKERGAYLAAKAERDRLDGIEDAITGQRSLTEALYNGPLSAHTDGGFDPAVTEKLIAAYSKSGRMAEAAVGAAANAKYPGVVADAVGPMIDRAKTGFKVDGKGEWNQPYAEKYGGSLLKQAGELGPDFVAGMPAYLDSGEQFHAGAAGVTGPTFDVAMTNRSRKLAGALVKPDGSTDVTGSGATAAIGNLLYHPDVMDNPTPGLSENVLRTVKMLKDPVTGPQASTVLKGVTAPTDPSGLTLVRNSLGKGPTDAVDDGGARTAVLAAMLQPFNQGAVGSCFSTGPLRKQREEQPIATMKAYAQLASKGTFTPGVGPELPAVTNLPPGEDPLMRSLEYTAASAGARLADSNRRAVLTGDVQNGTDMLKGVATKGVTTDADKVWAAKQQKLAKDVADALTFTYDPTVSSGPSSDGSSSKGRYMVVHKGASISTKEDFQKAMLEIAVASLGLTAGSDEAKEVERIVTSDEFATKVCPRTGQAPWQLSSGGAARNTIEVLQGSKATERGVVAAATDPKPTEGERTKAVLAGLLKQYRGSSAQMATLDTVGQHTFNILPNDPSLAALKGANDTETQQKIQGALIDKGAAMKDTVLPADRAAWLFDKAIKEVAGSVTDPAEKALVNDGVTKNRPKADMRPAEVTAAVKAALEAYHDAVAQTRAATWKADQIRAGKTVGPTDEAAEKAKLKTAWQSGAGNAAKGALMKDLGAPEFVIADTNWGESRNHVYFVIAPDPDTGEPLMWKRTEPPGSLAPAGRDWVDRSWSAYN